MEHSSDLFKKLRFTDPGSSSSAISWKMRLDLIERYLRQSDQQTGLTQEHFPVNTPIQLTFCLEFHQAINPVDFGQEIHSSSVLLQIYVAGIPILSFASLDLKLRDETFSDDDRNWLEWFRPFFVAEPSTGALRIQLSAVDQIGVVQALCQQQRIFYLDPVRKKPTWFEWRSEPAIFRFRVRSDGLGDDRVWKVWGYFEGSQMDLWNVQEVTAGGLVRQGGSLFQMAHGSERIFPWILSLLRGGAISVPYPELGSFLFRAFQLLGSELDHRFFDFSDDVQLSLVKCETQPILYLRARDRKDRQKTQLEGHLWFRSQGQEFPSPVHGGQQNSGYLSFRQWVHESSIQVEFTIRDPDREAEFLVQLKGLSGVNFNFFRGAFHFNFDRTLEAVYFLLGQDWEIWAENLRVKILKEFEIRIATHQDWFDVTFSGGAGLGERDGEIAAWQIIHFLKKRALFIELGQGSAYVLPECWYLELQKLLNLRKRQETDESESSVRFSRSEAMDLAGLGAHVSGDEAFEAIRLEIEKVLHVLKGLKPMMPSPWFQYRLRPYQELGLSWFHFLGRIRLGGCLADDMGLGKTIQLLAYMDLKNFEAKQSSRRFRGLLVCPKSLCEHWAQESKKCAPRLKIHVLRASDFSHLEKIIESFQVVVASYGQVRVHGPLLDQVMGETPFDLVVLDEAQVIKNSKTQVSIAVKQLKGVQRIALTGTPIENHMGELLSIFEFLDPGIEVPDLMNSGLLPDGQVVSSGLEQFLKRVRPQILRRLKSEVLQDLPEKTEQTVILPMLERQGRIYSSLKKYYQENLNRISDRDFSQSFFLEGLLRLRQVACHPALLGTPPELSEILNGVGASRESDDSTMLEASNKLVFLRAKILELIASEHKVIVFSQFTSLLKIFRMELEHLDIPYEYLDGQTQDRMGVVNRFQDNPGIPILLASIKAGGLGLNLTAADYIFILDPWWNPAVENQAVNRIHRIGQDRKVFIYRLLSQSSVEEKITELHRQKQEVADQLLTSDHAFLEQLSYEDFKTLFSFS